MQVIYSQDDWERLERIEKKSEHNSKANVIREALRVYEIILDFAWDGRRLKALKEGEEDKVFLTDELMAIESYLRRESQMKGQLE